MLLFFSPLFVATHEWVLLSLGSNRDWCRLDFQTCIMMFLTVFSAAVALALAHGRPEQSLRAQMAKESQWMLLRPFCTFVGMFCVFLVLKDSIDIYDKVRCLVFSFACSFVGWHDALWL